MRRYLKLYKESPYEDQQSAYHVIERIAKKHENDIKELHDKISKDVEEEIMNYEGDKEALITEINLAGAEFIHNANESLQVTGVVAHDYTADKLP